MRYRELPGNQQGKQRTSFPLQEGVYTVKPGKLPNTLIFCPNCQLTIFNRQILTREDILSFTAAQQLAQQHADTLHHTVCQVDPEQII